ncbi:hypothetical protein [Marinicrinis sediminis]|uniref:Uncharacterized protein n=1 Tax=Marinicrinis sediminis TaxID=1652465 RepID=A0ABW5R7R5_9BACL
MRIVNNEAEEENYEIIYVSSTEIFEGDAISFIGVPTIHSGFDNVGGGFTNSIIVVGSYVEIVEE